MGNLILLGYVQVGARETDGLKKSLLRKYYTYTNFISPEIKVTLYYFI